ncbi:hypothetical protein ACE1SV_62650 [Streptomyces sennicomposti]
MVTSRRTWSEPAEWNQSDGVGLEREAVRTGVSRSRSRAATRRSAGVARCAEDKSGVIAHVSDSTARARTVP